MKNLTKENQRPRQKARMFEILNYMAALTAIGLGVLSLTEGYGIGYFVISLFLMVLFIANGIFLKSTIAKGISNGILESKLQEKEILLKEVHHRVKNNLQTVSSLLSLQSRAIEDKKISSIIKSSQNRVVSMAMVHEMLYKRDDYTSKIALKPYVEELCEYLVRSVKGNDHNIDLNLDVGDFKLSIDTVIPLGLIINETVTNALKYGILENTEGEILVRLSKKGVNTYEMYLGDNGIGFPEDINPTTIKSLGLKLIHNLSRQLRGEAQRDMKSSGTYYQITFEEVIDDFNSVD
ncbi:hypothetical protein MTsPCn5_38980 [Croceitalea sp. MTPC5]|uniref:sensor histidine kinase n=1 Tax=Croceitalea sp. MTPC5 TaxID=3056565 RepID=UPI002B3C3D47|nr:hypothetical protein MTsPCn5_38980 [Croceitalea sp. MTPC5]